MRLSETSVLALACKARPYRVYDDGRDGCRVLHILVQPSGTRTYRVELARNRYMKIGRVEDLTLAGARAKAIELRRAANRGEDPRSPKPVTFGDVLARFTTYQVKVKERVSAERVAGFVRYSCPKWLDRPMGSIAEREIIALLDAKRDSGTKHASTRLYAHLRTCFKWAARRKLISVNTMADVENPWQVKRSATARKRAWFKGELADGVIRSLWHYADEIGGHRGRFIKMMVITGKRVNAIRDMNWEHIAQDWYWQPTYRADNKRNNPIPLPKLAQRVLSPRGLIGRVLPPMGSVQHLAARVRGVPDDFIWHGLRHIMITKLRELRVPPHIARLIMDHADSDVHSGYEHGDSREECLEALEIWCAYVERLVTPAAGISVLR